MAIVCELWLFYRLLYSCSLIFDSISNHWGELRNLQCSKKVADHVVLNCAKQAVNLILLYYSSIVTATFNVQNLTLTEQEGGHELNVHCGMAKGAEDKNCTVMMRNESGVLLQNCFATSARNATCKLSGLALGEYMIQGYDWEWEETPAVEHAYPFTKKLSEDSTNS